MPFGFGKKLHTVVMIDDRLKLSSIDNAIRNESFTLEYSRHLKLWY